MFRKLLTIAGISLAMGVGPALAQTQEQSQQPQEPPQAQEQPQASPPPADKVITEQTSDQVLSHELVGMEVMGSDGKAIGTLQSLLFDSDNRIVGAVVSIGGFLGIGAKQVALSWDQFDVRQSEGEVHVDLGAEQLQAAQDFKDLKTKKAEEDAARLEQERRQQMQQQQQQQPPPR